MLCSSKSILSLLSLIMLVSVKSVHGDGTVDDACTKELLAYQTCAINNQDVCDSGCTSTEEPEMSEEDILKMMTDPNFMCDWFNEVFCSIQQCCDTCNDEANAYFSCLAVLSTEDGNCAFVCTDNGGAVDNGSDPGDGSDNGGTADNGSDPGDGSDNGDTVDNGSDNGGTGGGSSASPSLSGLKVLTAVVMVVGYTLV